MPVVRDVRVDRRAAHPDLQAVGLDRSIANSGCLAFGVNVYFRATLSLAALVWCQRLLAGDKSVGELDRSDSIDRSRRDLVSLRSAGVILSG